MTLLLSAISTLVSIVLYDPALGCSVCFADPDSAMARGATMGVVVMVGVVGFVLLSIASTGLFWMHRGRRLSRRQSRELHSS